MTGFRMVMISTSTYNGQYSTTGPKLTSIDSGSNIRSSLPIIGTILPVMNLHGQQNVLWKSKPVDINYWRHWTCIVLGNIMNFSLCASMAGFCSASHIVNYVHIFIVTPLNEWKTIMLLQ